MLCTSPDTMFSSVLHYTISCVLNVVFYSMNDMLLYWNLLCKFHCIDILFNILFTINFNLLYILYLIIYLVLYSVILSVIKIVLYLYIPLYFSHYYNLLNNLCYIVYCTSLSSLHYTSLHTLYCVQCNTIFYICIALCTILIL